MSNLVGIHLLFIKLVSEGLFLGSLIHQMTDTTLHVADRADLLALDAEWREEYAKLMVHMTTRIQALQGMFTIKGAGNIETMTQVYEGTKELRVDLEKLKQREKTLVDKLAEKKDEWDHAVSTRSGELGKLDSRVAEQTTTLNSHEHFLCDLDEKRQACEKVLAFLKEQILEAEHSLAVTQGRHASLRQECRDGALKSLSGREQRLTTDIQDFERQRGEALDKQEKRQDDIERRELRLARLEQTTKIANCENNRKADSLNTIRQSLRKLAIEFGNDRNTPSSPESLTEIAESIRNRFRNLELAFEAKSDDLTAHKAQVVELESKLEYTIRQVGGLQKSVEDERKNLEVSRQNYDSLVGVDFQLQQTQRELREQNDELTLQRNHAVELGSKLATANREVESLQTSHDHQKGLLDASRRETARLAGKGLQLQHVQAELHAKDKVLISQQEDNIELENRLNTANERLELLQFSYDDQNRQLENVRKAALRLPAKESQLKQIRLELSEALASLEQVIRQKDGLKDAVEVLEDNLKDAQAAKDEGAKQLGETKQGLSDSRTGCAVLRSRNESLQAQLDAAFKVRDEQAKDLVGLVTDIIPALRSSEQSRMQENEELKSDNTYLRQRAEQGESETKALQTLNDELNTSRNRAIEICAVERKTVTSLRSENHKLREQASTHRNKADEVESSLATERHKLAGLEESCRTKEAEIERFKATHSLTGAKAAGLSSEVSQKNDVIVDLNRRLDELQTTKSKESERNTAAFIEKDDQIQQLTQHAQVLQSTIKAEAEKFTLELSGKDGRIADLARKLELLEVKTNAEKERYIADLADKDQQVKDLSDHTQDLNFTINDMKRNHEAECNSKETDIANLHQRVHDFQSTAVAEAAAHTRTQLAKVQELEVLRKQIEDTNRLGMSKDSRIEEISRKLTDLRETTSQQIRDLRSTHNININEISNLRPRVQKLQDALDGERASFDELSQKSEHQLQEIEQKQRRILAQNTENAELTEIVERSRQELEEANSMNRELQDRNHQIEEYELDRIGQLKEDVDQLKGRVSRRDARIAKLDEEKARLTERLGSLTEERDALQEEFDQYGGPEESVKVGNVHRRASTLLIGRLSRQPSEDQEEEILDESSVQRRKSGQDSRGRKRKSSEIASAEDEENTSRFDKRAGERGGKLGRVPKSTSSSSNMNPGTRPVAKPGNSMAIIPNGSTVTPSTRGTFTISIMDAIARNCTSDVLSPNTLEALQAQISSWSQRSPDWSKDTQGFQRKCVTMRLKKKKSEWDDGEDFGCRTCQAAGHICAVVQKNGTLQLLPRKDSGRVGLGPRDEAYWIL